MPGPRYRQAEMKALEVLQACGDARPLAAQRKTLGPLDDDDGGFGERIFETQRLEVGKSFDAVKVDVVDL